MLLQRPDPVVAHDAHDRNAVSDHGVELHRGEAERAVARDQDHLPVGPRKLRRHRVARSGAKAPERSRVDPQAGLVALDQPAGE